jgi:ABC-type transport system involved in multi-copper enzyme maturation permease subunit
MSSVAAELLVLRKRASTWILLAVWVVLGLLFAYLLPYLTYTGGAGGTVPAPLELMLPHRLADNLLGGYPFFGGVLALMLGVLAIGSDYGWDTLKTLFVQRPGRTRVLGAKLAAIAVALMLFVVASFLSGAVATYLIAGAEDAAVRWPSALELAGGVATGWFILATWAAFGVLLAVASRGTALAIGLGILYALIIEGLLSALAGQVAWLEAIVEYFLRANAYSLVSATGVPTAAFQDSGPGSFFGPFVGAGQAIVVMAAYAASFLALSAVLLRRRDVS